MEQIQGWIGSFNLKRARVTSVSHAVHVIKPSDLTDNELHNVQPPPPANKR